jgi:hypothetical protein
MTPSLSPRRRAATRLAAQAHGRTTRLSSYYTLAALTASETAAARGIDNRPPQAVVANLRVLARGLDRVRRLLGHPLVINSGYRCPELNVAVGGAARSQHTEGFACDLECPGFGAPMEVARAIVASPIAFDTLILEFGCWVHLSFTPTPRRRVMTIRSVAEGYLDGLVAPPRDASVAQEAARPARDAPTSSGSASPRPRR